MYQRSEEKRTLDIRTVMAAMGLDENKFEFVQKDRNLTWPLFHHTHDSQPLQKNISLYKGITR